MNRHDSLRVFALLLCLCWGAGLARAEAAPMFHPRTLLGGEYWGTVPKDGYLDYLGAVKPDLIHGSLLGPELCSAVYGAGKLKGITPVYPEVGTVKEYLAWWRSFNAEAHRRGVKVQGTFSLTYVWGDREKHTGFFKYYGDLWEADVLGAKPSPSPEAFLRMDAAGQPIHDKYNDWYTYAGCLNNPTWRQLLKQMVKAGIDAGFDGFMVQFPYFDNRCVCPYCQEKFKAFLTANYTQEELQKEMGIPDLAAHKFAVIGSPEKTTPSTPAKPESKQAQFPKLDLAARQFGAVCVKDCFDDVFVEYGRTLKPDLVLSMWTHFRQFVAEDATNTDFNNYLDERTLLPIERWGKGENYLWYSSPMYKSDLKNGVLGDSALDGRVLRAMAGDTAFELLKYDYFRWRVVTAESLASGGICFGAKDGGWSGGQDREEPYHLKSYYQFIRDNDAYLNPLKRESYAEVAMIYPRQAILAGDATFFGPFRNIGRALLKAHILFDVIIDQKMTAADLAKHKAVIVFPHQVTEAQRQLLSRYIAAGGKVIVHDAHLVDGSLKLEGDLSNREDTARKIAELAGTPFSTFDAPWTVQVYADRQPKDHRVLVHLVNFNRDESQGNKELPIAAAPVKMDLRLPENFMVTGVKFLTPEAKDVHLAFKQQGGRVQLTTPGYLVYGLVVIQGKPAPNRVPRASMIRHGQSRSLHW
ncbi:MAG: hypothetical protein ACYC6A_13145 [Armatimonadota bacterium]